MNGIEKVMQVEDILETLRTGVIQQLGSPIVCAIVPREVAEEMGLLPMDQSLRMTVSWSDVNRYPRIEMWNADEPQNPLRVCSAWADYDGTEVFVRFDSLEYELKGRAVSDVWCIGTTGANIRRYDEKVSLGDAAVLLLGSNGYSSTEIADAKRRLQEMIL